ncbi:hypothetical protein QTP88_015590 [Uroleucon formosanum]
MSLTNLQKKKTLIKLLLLEEIDDKELLMKFILSYDQFTYVLNLIEDDIKCNAYNRHKEPINLAEKLALTLRNILCSELGIS